MTIYASTLDINCASSILLENSFVNTTHTIYDTLTTKPFIDHMVEKHLNYACPSEKPEPPIDPSKGFKPYSKIFQQFNIPQNIFKYLFFRSMVVTIAKTEINGNIVIAADILNILDRSYLNTFSSGYDETGIGTANLIVSYRFSCGTSGGAYAGWGGFGIAGNLIDTTSCI